jgi:hypothetical protein
MDRILEYLKQHKEGFDTEIAKATGIALHKARYQISELAANHEIMVCHSVRIVQGEKVEGTWCRIAGYSPSATAGRKSNAQLKASAAAATSNDLLLTP